MAGLILGLSALEPRRVWRRAGVGAAMLAAPFAVYVVGPQLDRLAVPGAERWGPRSPWAEAYPVAAFVRSHSPPGSTLIAAGSDPEVNWLSDRLAPTRFFDILPVNAHPAYGAERAARLASSPPRTIVALAGAPIDPALKALVTGGHYQLAYNVRGSRVWLSGPGTAAAVH
ncbi:MAG TPA: hypothetical protein VGN69_09205 [Solirubrobacteraceae bacterium]|nr:hypothetical protein [Solirubrobacteraceae bacterium]